MEENTMDKISELLNSPDLLKNVQSILGKLGTSEQEKPDIVLDENSENFNITDIMKNLGGNNLLSSITSFLSENKTERIALLSALRPFLSADKQATLDSILQILKIANILLASNMLT